MEGEKLKWRVRCDKWRVRVCNGGWPPIVSGTFLPDIDMIDCAVRQENIHARGDPIMLQLPLVPAYALTVHKTQAVVLSRAVSLYLLVMFSATRTHSHVTRTSPDVSLARR
jgi:hypothetical protein